LGWAIDRAAVHGDLASGARRQPTENAQQRRLAGARGPAHGEKPAPRRLEGEAAKEPPRALLVGSPARGPPAGENDFVACWCAPAGGRRTHGAVTTIAALSIGAVSWPRSLRTSIQTPSSFGVIVKR